MGQRIKIGDLAFLVGNLNIVTGNPVEHCTKGESGLFVSNAGNYYFSQQSGGVRLEQLCEGGGARDISPRLSKGQLFDWINAFLKGIEIGQNINEEVHNA
jgi:hypothetical protein